MADLTRLKARARKGTPPTPEVTNSNLKTPPREGQVKKTKIEFSVPEHMANEFSQEAGQCFGFKKGSKSDLFIAMWQEYQARKAGYLCIPAPGRNALRLGEQGRNRKSTHQDAHRDVFQESWPQGHPKTRKRAVAAPMAFLKG